MIKAVIDTSVWVSAFITKSESASVLIYKAFVNQQFISVISPQILVEIEDVMNRAKIVSLHHLPIEFRQRIIYQLANLCLVTTGLTKLTVSADSKDDIFIAAAVESQASFVVSLDKRHLISIKEYEGIKVISAGEFVKILSLGD